MDGIAQGVATGDFHPEPGDKACRYCDFQMLCGPGRKAEAQRKADDPHVEWFHRVVRGGDQ